MILKSYGYLSAYDEYCEVNVEGAYINRNMRIENLESGTSCLFLILVYNTDVSKVQIVNKETVPGSV